MPRRRFITIGCFAAAVFACAFVAYFAISRRTPEAYYQGRSASYWLREVFGNRGRQSQALEAFRQMGTNADPVLVAAIEGREKPLARIHRQVYRRLSAAVRQRLPQPDNLAELRSTAGLILLNTQKSHTVPQLLPWLEEPDSEVRRAVLQTVMPRIGPKNASQVPLILLAANDPDVGVKVDAGRALWKITGQTNDTAESELKRVLSQSQDASERHWAAVHLLEMGQANQLLTKIFINSLTNSQPGLKMSACSCLGQIGPPAAAAVPALRIALQDPDPEVRRRAKLALSRIEPGHQ
jgi:HEAT repeat protein